MPGNFSLKSFQWKEPVGRAQFLELESVGPFEPSRESKESQIERFKILSESLRIHCANKLVHYEAISEWSPIRWPLRMVRTLERLSGECERVA